MFLLKFCLGISSTGLNHIEHYWNISDDLAERRSLKQLLTKQRVEWLLLSHSGQSIKVRALPYSRGFAKFIPDEEEKMKYLISEMGLRRSVVNTLLDKDLIVSPTFRTAFFYDPVYGSFKAIKLFDHQSISEILKNKVTDFENQSFKGKFKVFFFFFFIFHFRLRKIDHLPFRLHF